jgi:2,4-dienoyl-CoA reductase-like NADH-dependent reductase (Old Yellow Enzyme family)
VCQLNHGGRQVNSAHKGIVPLCPSKADFPGAKFTPEVLCEGDIERIIGDFGSAAARSRAAGFDGVQIHSAHGYLISQFNSPLTNTREDAWGGSPEKRRRFLMAVYESVRGAVGADYPILVKQNVSEFHPDGMGLDEALAICEMLDDAGIAAIELSGGIAETIPVAFRAEQLRRDGEVVFFEEECRALRERVSCPLILTGGIRRRDTAERLLADGVCDAVGMCRPFIREPDLPRTWQRGLRSEAACISCGKCRQSPERCNTCALDA